MSNVTDVLESHKNQTAKVLHALLLHSHTYVASSDQTLAQACPADRQGIKAHFRLDESGILHLESTDAHFETVPQVQTESVESILDTISSFLGGGMLVKWCRTVLSGV